MGAWRKTLVLRSTPIIKVVDVLDHAGFQVALVVDENNRLQGTVTDGDIRRGLLRGVNLNGPVEQIMNPAPTVVAPDTPPTVVKNLLSAKGLRQIPVVDAEGAVQGLMVADDLFRTEQSDNIVVIMAGGFGKRLLPLTKDCPKPMLPLGEKPILEIILDRLIKQGFCNFYFSVNYLASQVEDHFGDGSRWGISIRYLRESSPLGTAGALGLLPEKPSKPILVMNGDLLTQLNFNSLLDFHAQQQTVITMCVREYDFQVPFGVVSLETDFIDRIVEKPTYTYFVNSGIYVLQPQVLARITPHVALDMPDIIERLRSEGYSIGAFPIRESWIDIGNERDFHKAKAELSADAPPTRLQ